MNQVVTTASVIRNNNTEVEKIKVDVIGQYGRRNYELKKGAYYILEPINEELKHLKDRLVLIKGFKEITAGYSVKVFLVEEKKELIVALGELKSLSKN
ncbi:hypothetical protein VXN63_08985 [Marinilactibacillus sp. XAAS-LB27]|uniref:hypothetical protein n=1 Tax=Marinilactibacillus sp. XAAS-LB27 TaxID=3114538 RepID=UPI002E186C83|nr:hypothetical protein [Marinilactibacillus sp. XAAS-LB27]